MVSSSTIKPYRAEFYDETFIISSRSAKQIVPMVLELLGPQSVIDLGCGAGTWVSAFAQHGVKDFFGVDGPWVEKAALQIPEDHFLVHDLSRPFKLDRKFDLAISFEVAEHLPASSAENFVESLVSLSDKVLFSAAVPFQGGTNHINEQWPEYWAQIFAANGYRVIDCFRQKLWQNEEVAYWFAQNMLLFVREDVLTKNPTLQAYAEATEPNYLSRIHPKMFLKSRESLSSPKSILMRKVWNALPKYIRIRLMRHLGHKLWEQVNTKYD